MHKDNEKADLQNYNIYNLKVEFIITYYWYKHFLIFYKPKKKSSLHSHGWSFASATEAAGKWVPVHTFFVLEGVHEPVLTTVQVQHVREQLLHYYGEVAV